jgi:transposase
MGRLEKTDRIDAGMIAWYAEVRQSRPVCLAPENQQQLRAMVTRLRQLTDLRTAQLNQQQRIARLIEQDPLWSELNQRRTCFCCTCSHPNLSS